MSAALTIGKRLGGVPSESGSMRTRCPPGAAVTSAISLSVCGMTATATLAEFTHRLCAFSDSRRPGKRDPGLRQRTTEVIEMSTILQQAEQMAGEQLKKMRWALGLSGALSVLFGIVILVWPSISLYALVIVFGA